MYYSCNCYNGIYIIDIEYLIREEEYLFGKKKKNPPHADLILSKVYPL